MMPWDKYSSAFGLSKYKNWKKHFLPPLYSTSVILSSNPFMPSSHFLHYILTITFKDVDHSPRDHVSLCFHLHSVSSPRPSQFPLFLSLPLKLSLPSLFCAFLHTAPTLETASFFCAKLPSPCAPLHIPLSSLAFSFALIPSPSVTCIVPVPITMYASQDGELVYICL